MFCVQAVFKKFLSATKNKVKGNLKLHGGGGLGGAGGPSSLEQDEEFEARKHEWQVGKTSPPPPLPDPTPQLYSLMKPLNLLNYWRTTFI